MQWKEGDSFSEERALKICTGVASALAHLHGMGVCHGDVYAHNILVDEDHHAVLCDFGACVGQPRGQTYGQTVWC